MKIKVKNVDYDYVMSLPPQPHRHPKKPNILFRTLLKIVSTPDLLATRFKCEKIGMQKLGKKEPALILMNHSSFIDLKIASSVLYPRPFNIVCTSDGFVGKNWLMRQLGCIPTQKFVSDLTLIRDIKYALGMLHSSVLMYPEAGYSFDGTATTLPDTVGKLLKMLGVPVIMIRTYGAFSRDPLYNGLQLRRVKVSAKMEYILSPDDIKQKSADEINDILHSHFTFDSFRWQQQTALRITEGFRADGLNRVLYKCPHCLAEGDMHGEGITLTCHSCGKVYTLDELGYIFAEDGTTEFPHIPDWYTWQRKCVREEIEAGKYALDTEVDICMLVNTKCLYRVGNGRLTHTPDGFHLVGCDGKLDYSQPPIASYCLNSDYFWYELGDMICIGDRRVLYYCFPHRRDIVTKTRLAAEELFKITRRN
ncbi:MAG: 1-acyl-sn-glycerol-3-phosphate acyltransferase [Clostridia bacterium]|nr:1-acyl-sn-glycerol-3-phosphate acyltransferase [Clostridia bacterium]